MNFCFACRMIRIYGQNRFRWKKQQNSNRAVRWIPPQHLPAYPKFSLSPSEIHAIIDEKILPYIDVVEPDEIIAGICRDPNDEKFLTAAQAGNASHLISGDRDLLVLQTFRGIKIVTPQEFQAASDVMKPVDMNSAPHIIPL